MWQVSAREQQLGQFTTDQLAFSLVNGRLDPNVLVWWAPTQQWVPAQHVPEIRTAMVASRIQRSRHSTKVAFAVVLGLAAMGLFGAIAAQVFGNLNRAALGKARGDMSVANAPWTPNADAVWLASVFESRGADGTIDHTAKTYAIRTFSRFGTTTFAELVADPTDQTIEYTLQLCQDPPKLAERLRRYATRGTPPLGMQYFELLGGPLDRKVVRIGGSADRSSCQVRIATLPHARNNSWPLP